MTVTVTYNDIEHAVNQLIDERGENYIYPAQIGEYDSRNCRYWHEEENAPGCMVGAVLFRLGATEEQLCSAESQGAGMLIEHLLNRGWLFQDRVKTEKFLSEFQSAQDSGATWGFARHNAAELVRLKEMVTELLLEVNRTKKAEDVVF